MRSQRSGNLQYKTVMEEGEKQHHERLEQVQQLFLLHRERTNSILSLIAEMVDLAVQKMSSKSSLQLVVLVEL